MRNNQYIWETNSKNPDIDLSVTRFENNKLIHFLRQIKDTSIALSQQKAKANDDGVTSAAVVDNNIVSTTKWSFNIYCWSQSDTTNFRIYQIIPWCILVVNLSTRTSECKEQLSIS